MGVYVLFSLKAIIDIGRYDIPINLYTGNPKRGTLTNSEKQDKSQHFATFHQGLHCL